MRRLSGAVLGVALLALGAVARPDDVPRVPRVAVVYPVVRQVIDSVDLPGRAEASSSVEIRARVTGFIEKITFKEGSEVKRGDLLFQLDSRPYMAEMAKAEAILVQAEARQKRCAQDLARARALLGKGAIAQDEFDKIMADRDEAEAAVTIAKASCDLMRLNLDYTRVRAPIDGRIGRALMTSGNLVKADETLLTTIVSTKPMYVYFDIDERTVVRLRKAAIEARDKEMKAVPVDVGLASEVGYGRRGRVDFTDNRVDPKTGTLLMRAVLANEDGLLMPGMFLRVRLPLGGPAKRLLVPETAIHSEGGKKFAFVVNEKDAVAVRPVVLGSKYENLIVVTEGLNEKDRVVIGRRPEVRAGMLVQPALVPAPKSPE